MLAPGNKKSEITEAQFGDGDQLGIYKELNGLLEDGYVGKFVAVTFEYKDDLSETFNGFVMRKTDERKVGEIDHWDIYFEDTSAQPIALTSGDWEWDYI